MTEITINMVYNGKEVETSAKVLTTYGEGILVTPIICDGQEVEYCSNGTFVYKDPYTDISRTFVLESITRTDFEGSFFHVLTGKENQVIDKKRKAERYMVQKMGLALVNKKISTNMMINDISMRGVSLLIGSDRLVHVGDDIEVFFFIDGGRRLKIDCKVVRLFKVHNISAAGCVFNNVSTDIISYVQDKKVEYNKKMNVKVAG